ncbi:hypothetical protein RclHR1_12140007 [Rhizophagus clarus]|uniref:RNase H type-1 domain-containing protein n=1 Tax=Rhizophagus clarus TaxID=94130 RepID=A0A2Z6QYB1_9GLOM|nr:hypothetical protein RclHR1_12140007 [Rhizophagus clarus]
MKVVAAIHNSFIQKLRTRIWNPRTYDKSKWEDAMNITLKLKTTSRPSNLPATSYVPFFSLPPLTHLVTPRDSEIDWIKNSMIQDLPWFKHLSGFMGRLTANFSRSLPNPILYLSQALGLINLSSHLIQCHVNNLFLMANSSTPFIQRLFIYRLMLIQFRFLIPISPLMVDDWSLWSNMNIFKYDYIACTIASMVSTPFRLQHAQSSSTFPDLTLPGHTPLYSCMSPHVFKACLKVLRKCHLYYLSQLIAPSGSHLISWTAYRTAYIAQLEDKRGRSLPHKWYLDIKTNTTLSSSHDQLSDHYVRPPSVTSSIVLLPGATTTQKNRHWLVSLDGNGAPLFGKQLSVQPKKDTCVIVHWISDCFSSPGDVIHLRPCPSCDAHVLFPSANKYTAVQPRYTFKISLLRSMVLPTNCERIRQSTTEILSPYTWADLSIMVIPYYQRLNLLPDFSSSSFVVEDDLIVAPLVDDQSLLSPPVLLPSESHYCYYTDGSLINLGTPEVSMGWSWVQLISDAGYLNSVVAYTHGTIRNWPSSSRAEAAAIYAALSVTPADSTVTIYTDFQAAIDGLSLCASSSYSNSRLFYKTTNFELWASIERLIHTKSLAVSPVKVKGHDGNYWNDFADSLANSAHHSDTALLLPVNAYTSSHPVRLVYDNVVCESNPRRLFKLHFQATFLKDFLSLKRFQFVYCLTNKDDYVVDWEITWFTLDFSSAHDASFQAFHAARYHTFKFKLFLDDLPLLEKLKVTRSDLYIDLLTCRSCCDRMEDLLHLILCSKRRSVMHQILLSYQNHLFAKLREAGELAAQDPTPLLRKLSSLSCWTISSSNWPSAMKVVAAIYNNFIQKLRTRIWNPRTYDKSKWEDAMNITLKLKTTPRPSNLPATSYVPFSSLPPPTHLVIPHDSDIDWIKNSMVQDIDLAPLTEILVLRPSTFPFPLNSYKPKRWAYVTFNSPTKHGTESLVSDGHTLQWNLPDNTNKLCHRCGKLGCAPSPGNSQSSQPQKPLANTRLNNNPRRDRSKSNDKRDRSVSFSTVLRSPPPPSPPDQATTMSPHEAANILSLLKSLQQDMADVRDRITALELNDRRMTRIEQHLGLLPRPDIPPQSDFRVCS